MKKLFVIISLVFCFISCTENVRTRKFGGTQTIKLPKGKKVMMATWKNSNLFYMI